MKQKTEILQTILDIVQVQLLNEIHWYDHTTEREEMKQLRYEAVNCVQAMLRDLNENGHMTYKSKDALDELIKNVRELDYYYEYGIFDTFTGAMPSIQLEGD